MATDIERLIYSHRAPRTRVSDQDDLFTTFGDRVLRRAQQVIDGVDCRWPASRDQIQLLGCLLDHQGKNRAVPLEFIARRLGCTPRAVKDLVQELRLNFGVLVGASREANGGGYYLVESHTEVAETTGQMRSQATTMFRVIAAMHTGDNAIDNLLHQLRLDLTAAIEANPKEGTR
jgi:biotin operon repressor